MPPMIAPGTRQGGQHLGDLGRDGQDAVEVTSSAPARCRSSPRPAASCSAATSTASFRAFDDRTGKVLWEQNLGAPVVRLPVTFAVDGKQYVAVTTGASLVSTTELRLTPELKPGASGQLFVFALP